MGHSKKRHAFTALLDDQAVAEMDGLVEATRCSKAHIVRTSIAACYQHTVARVPTCASGILCPYPEYHRAKEVAKERAAQVEA